MAELLEVGYWYSVYEPYYPKPKEGAWDEQTKRKVLQHLNEGEVKHRWRGLSSCRVCGCFNGSTCLTDGVFLWPEGLAHYVEEHDTALPDLFVQYVLQGTHTRIAFDALMERKGEVYVWTPLSEEEKRQVRSASSAFRRKQLLRGMADRIRDDLDEEFLQEILQNVREPER